MAISSIKLIKRPNFKLQGEEILKEITKQLQPVGRQHVNERKRIVANFDTRIVFGYDVTLSQAQITLTIAVTNSEQQLENSDWTVGDLWKALDKSGTKPHDIKPTNPQGVLRFQWGGPGSYEPHTRPVARFGGPGAVQNGETVLRKRVRHPGFQPRRFSDSINKRLRRQFEQAIDRGFRLGARKRR